MWGTILSKRRYRASLTGYVFITPSVILYLAFLGAPLVYALFISFHQWSGMRAPVFIGIANYGHLLNDNLFWGAMRVTLLFAALSVPLTTAVALVTAVLVNQMLPLRYLFRSMTFVPAIIAGTVVGVIWLFVYQPDVGLLNEILRLLHISGHLWLGDTLTALPALVVVSMWQRFGWFSVLFLAGLQDIPTEQLEAAAIDGASRWNAFVHITFPLLRPTLALVVVLAALGSFQVFDLVYVMTGGGPFYATETLSFYIYNQAFRAVNMGYATSMAWVLFGFIFILTLVQLRVLRPATD